MKIFFFLFFVLFGQLPLAFAKEPSFYEEFDYAPQALSSAAAEKEADSENSARSEHPETDQREVLQENNAAEPLGMQERDFILTDEKHARFLQENEQYALADAMLNLTWKELVAVLNKKAYRELWKNHKHWLEHDRNTVAQSFLAKLPDIPEDHAFMLAQVAKTQELAQKIWRSPEEGTYKKGNLQVSIVREDGKTFVQGYGEIPVTVLSPAAEPKSLQDTEKNGTESNIRTQKIRQLLFRAELPEHGKLWLALTAVSEQKLYILTMKNQVCLVHAQKAFPLDFNGVFIK